MSLTQLRYFLAIARAGTMSGASRHIGIAQPALSLQVARLEEELGQTLFVRHGRGMTLTEMGQRLQGWAVEILRQVDLAKEDLSSDTDSPSGTVSVGMATAANMAFSVDLLMLARKRCPRLRVQHVESMSGFLLEWVERGRIDMAVVYDVPPHASLVVETLMEEELYLVTGAEAASPADGEAVPFATLATLPLIIPGRQHRLGQLLHRLATLQEIDLDVTAEVDSTYAIKELVRRGEGFSILSLHAVQEEIARGELRVVPIDRPAIRRSIDLVTHPLRRLNPSVGAIRKIMLELVAKLPVREGRGAPTTGL